LDEKWKFQSTILDSSHKDTHLEQIVSPIFYLFKFFQLTLEFSTPFERMKIGQKGSDTFIGACKYNLEDLLPILKGGEV